MHVFQGFGRKNGQKQSIHYLDWEGSFWMNLEEKIWDLLILNCHRKLRLHQVQQSQKIHEIARRFSSTQVAISALSVLLDDSQKS